jgi:hypothetical protein
MTKRSYINILAAVWPHHIKNHLFIFPVPAQAKYSHIGSLKYLLIIAHVFIAAFDALQCSQEILKYRYFEAKSTKPLEKVQILALK